MGNSGGKAKEPKVKKRKGNVGKKDNRPASDPVGYASSSGEVHGLRRAGSEDIGGADYYEADVSFTTDPSRARTLPATPKAPPTDVAGTSALANDAVLSLYKKRLQLVLEVWPELSGLNDVDIRSLRGSAVDALHTLYKTAHDEYQEAETTRQQKQELQERAGTLEKRMQRQEDELRRKENELESLDREVKLLTGELRRRGIEPRLLERGPRPLPEEPPSDYDTIPVDAPSGSSSRDARGDGEEGGTGEKSLLGKKKGMSGRVATPLLQAEGSIGLSKAIVQRSQSLKNTSGSPSQHRRADQARAPEMSNVVEDLNQRLRTLQLTLDEESRRKKSLEERLESLEGRGLVSNFATGSGPTPDTLRSKYDDLEGQALSRVVTSLYRNLSHVTHADVTQFLCTTMLVAYEQAAEHYQRFQGFLHALLMSPVNPDLTGSEQLNNSQNNKRFSGNINKFEKGIASKVSGSRLAQRTRATSELPSNLEEEVRDFIRLTSESTNVEQLTETVFEGLYERWPSCATPSVRAQAAFTDYLYQCCRLAWQLNTTSPPCYVTVDDSMRFDERAHSVLPVQGGTKPTIGAQIDYYAWPVLYRKRHGEVLYRGRVALAMRL